MLETFSSSVAGPTYQPNQEEEDLKAAAESCDADDVPVADSGHGDHEEIYAVPVGETLAIGEVWRVPGILQLKQTCQETPRKSFRLKKVK